MFMRLFASIGGENGPEFPPSSEGGGRNNIKLNPVFRGMVFRRRIKIKRKIKMRTEMAGHPAMLNRNLALNLKAKNLQPKETCA
jgi:hypothetical protein